MIAAYHRSTVHTRSKSEGSVLLEQPQPNHLKTLNAGNIPKMSIFHHRPRSHGRPAVRRPMLFWMPWFRWLTIRGWDISKKICGEQGDQSPCTPWKNIPRTVSAPQLHFVRSRAAGCRFGSASLTSLPMRFQASAKGPRTQGPRATDLERRKPRRLLRRSGQ